MRGSLLSIFVALVFADCTAFAQQADEHAVAFGKTIYAEKANCASCHGWAGDGQGDPHAHGVAAKLRDTKLDRAHLIETISCGRPGTDMPHFDAFAYGEDPCYGMNEADVEANGNKPSEPQQSLQPREIAAVADYVLAAIAGKGPPTKAECVAYFGTPAPVCASYP